MSVELGREFNYAHGVMVYYGYQNNQPVMWIRRQIGARQDGNPRYPIYLDDAHKYRQDSREAEFCAHKVALYLHLTESLTIKSKSDKGVMAFIGGVIEQHLDDLLGLPPAPRKDFKDVLNNAVEHYGLTAKINGEVVLGE